VTSHCWLTVGDFCVADETEQSELRRVEALECDLATLVSAFRKYWVRCMFSYHFRAVGAIGRAFSSGATSTQTAIDNPLHDFTPLARLFQPLQKEIFQARFSTFESWTTPLLGLFSGMV
jgi:hypothetical protein